MDEYGQMAVIHATVGAGMSERQRLKATLAATISAGVCTPTSDSRNGHDPGMVAAYASQVAEAILCACGL